MLYIIIQSPLEPFIFTEKASKQKKAEHFSHHVVHGKAINTVELQILAAFLRRKTGKHISCFAF